MMTQPPQRNPEAPARDDAPESVTDAAPVRRFLVYYGELSLKKGNRDYFEHRLQRNMQSSLRGLNVSTIKRLFGRFLVEQAPQGDDQELLSRLSRTHGITHIDRVRELPLDVDAARAAVVDVASQSEFESFAIRVKRINKQFPLRTKELECDLGAAVASATGARVDLTRPEQTFRVLVLNKAIYVNADRVEGPGGLPVGSSGRVAVLLSGGIDSPVAAELMMKRGCRPYFVHFHSAPFTDESSVDKVVELADILCRNRVASDVHSIPFGEIQQKIVAEAPSPYRVLLYRRYMIRLAERFTMRKKCKAIVSGESLGQVSSQTLENLGVLDRTGRMPLLRPLLAFDKQEIVDIAERIGTYGVSIEPHADCCSFLMPPHPITNARIKDVEEIEAKLDLQPLLEAAFDAREVFPVGLQR